MGEPVLKQEQKEYKQCKYCSEDILATAIKCKHCGSDLTEDKPELKAVENDEGEDETTESKFKWNYFLGEVVIASANSFYFMHNLVYAEKSGETIVWMVGQAFVALLFLAGAFYEISKPRKISFVIRSSLCVVLTLIVLAAGFGAAHLKTNNQSSDQYVSIVKNGHFHNYPDKTIEIAINNFFKDPEWISFIGQDDIPYVNVEGSIEYINKTVAAKMQFKIDKKNKKF